MFVAATLNMQTLIDTFLMCYEVILHKCMHNDNNYCINCEFTTVARLQEHSNNY